jgi:hypothetical protein
MKKRNEIVKHIAILVLVLLFVAGTANAQVAGSPHDLSMGSGDYASSNQTQVCIFCHTPHHASTTQTPLWNRNDPATTYETYISPTIDAYTVAPEIDGSSILCLSCHDGVSALNSMIYDPLGTAMLTGDSVITGMANLDDASHLTNDHPISFAYADAITNGDGGLVAVPPAWALEDGKVQCASCHDVHSFGATAAMQPFLNHTKSGSALCLQCHAK